MITFLFLLFVYTITLDASHQLGLQSVENFTPPRIKKNEAAENLPTSCKDVQNLGHNVTDVYVIKPKFAQQPFLVVCDMETRNGGWAYILNRYDGNQDFYLNWKNYKHGFGSLVGEFWLGLEKIHQLTGYEVNELLVQLADWDGKKAYAHYNSFGVGSEDEGYSLKVIEGYSGSAGDSFIYHRGMKFGTNDRDNDIFKSDYCGRKSGGAWWYRDCKQSHLTGKYLGQNVTEANYHQGITWNTFHGERYSLREARMMVRPRDHNSPVSLSYKN